MRLRDYLPTRTFELAVHTADLATALGLPPDVPATAAAQALYIVAELAIADGLAGPLLLAVTDRTGLPAATRCSDAALLLSPPGAPRLCATRFIDDRSRDGLLTLGTMATRQARALPCCGVVVAGLLPLLQRAL